MHYQGRATSSFFWGSKLGQPEIQSFDRTTEFSSLLALAEWLTQEVDWSWRNLDEGSSVEYPCKSGVCLSIFQRSAAPLILHWFETG